MLVWGGVGGGGGGGVGFGDCGVGGGGGGGRGFFVGGEGDVGAGFEEGFPELGTGPDGGGVGCVVLDDGEDGGCYDAVGAGEVVVDFWRGEGGGLDG